MKTTVTFLFILLLATLNFAQNQEYSNKVCTYEQIEQNYLEGLKSENLGLKMSSAYFLGEMQSTKSVIPLMGVLRDSKTPQERIIAALSLVKIGDPRGIYLLENSSKFCECERTRRLCKQFYDAFLFSKYEDKTKYVLEGDKDLISYAFEIDSNLKGGK